MNSQKLDHAYNEICAKVKTYEGVDISQVNAFFPRLTPQAMSDGFLMLTADNDFIKTWIERHYLKFINSALEDLYGMPFTVLIEVNESAPAKEIVSIPAEPVNRNPVSAQEHQPAKEASQPEPANQPEEDSLIKTLTFENFVIGDSNRLAYSMAVAVAERPGVPTYNPLFIYGKSGLGKTHLLRAIQNYIHETLPHLKTIYVDAQQLVNDYTDASLEHDKEKGSFKTFKNKYEESDVLLIDDVQFFQGKKQTLDIVFQIFNKLTSQGKQVVLSADRAPKNIDIDERYQSRFASGGTCDIQPPEMETKLGIIRSFIAECRELEGNEQITVPNDVQIYIAENSSSNIRELKSAVTMVITNMSITHEENPTVEQVSNLLQNHFSGGPAKRLSVADVQRAIEQFYKVSHADMVGKKRSRNVIHARHVAIYLCREMLSLPYNEIGKRFNRDHSTVMYSVNNIEMKVKENREMREELEAIKKILLDS